VFFCNPQVAEFRPTALLRTKPTFSDNSVHCFADFGNTFSLLVAFNGRILEIPGPHDSTPLFAQFREMILKK
jgi:hypothetical protein